VHVTVRTAFRVSVAYCSTSGRDTSVNCKIESFKKYGPQFSATTKESLDGSQAVHFAARAESEIEVIQLGSHVSVFKRSGS
jgi:hypothetical protein